MELFIGLFLLGVLGQLGAWMPEPRDERGLIYDLFKKIGDKTG